VLCSILKGQAVPVHQLCVHRCRLLYLDYCQGHTERLCVLHETSPDQGHKERLCVLQETIPDQGHKQRLFCKRQFHTKVIKKGCVCYTRQVQTKATKKVCVCHKRQFQTQVIKKGCVHFYPEHPRTVHYMHVDRTPEGPDPCTLESVNECLASLLDAPCVDTRFPHHSQVASQGTGAVNVCNADMAVC
jgi:hypothetical protein